MHRAEGGRPGHPRSGSAEGAIAKCKLQIANCHRRRTAEGGGRERQLQNAKCKLQNVNCRRGQRADGGRRTEETQSFRPSAFRLPPSAFLVRPPAPGPRPPLRRGISLIEVLFSCFVLFVGIWGLATIIDLGRTVGKRSEQADRAAACGRAALRDLKVRRMLDPYPFAGNPNQSQWVGYDSSGNKVDPTVSLISAAGAFAIDPLGVNYLSPSGSLTAQWERSQEAPESHGLHSRI